MADPIGYSLPDSERLREQYKEAVPVLAEDKYDHVLETLDRWNVPPSIFRPRPLLEDNMATNEYYHPRLGVKSILTGQGALSMLQSAVKCIEIDWVYTVANEPAVFWKSFY